MAYRSYRLGLRAFLRMGWPDRLQVLGIVATASVVEAGLRTIKLPTLARLLGVTVDFRSGGLARPLDEPLPDPLRRRISLVRTVLAYSPSEPTCLRSSLVCARVLRAVRPTVRIGVARVDGEVKAHAWVELAGRSIDPVAVEFVPVRFG